MNFSLPGRRWPAARSETFALLAISLLVCLCVALPVEVTAVSVAVIAAISIASVIGVRLLNGDAAPALLLWVALFPLGYYFLSFPLEKPLITFDRVIIAGTLVAVAVGSFRTAKIDVDLRRATVAWIVFLIAAGATLPRVSNVPSAARVYLEAFVLPLVLAASVVFSCDVRRHVRMLHAVTAGMVVYCLGIGIGEILTLRDLLPLPGGTLYEDSGIGIPRVNGPFLAPHSFALVGTMAVVFLLVLKRMAAGQGTPVNRFVHGTGCACAVLMSVLPMSRSIILSLLVILGVECWRGSRRVKVVAGLAALLLVAGLVWVSSALPQIVTERGTDDKNLIARFAQQKQTFDVFLSSPLLGVGLNDYSQHVPNVERYTGLLASTAALDAPHNNLGAIAAETGLLGLVPYLVAQVFMFRAFWRRRRDDPLSKIAWTGFFLVWFVYWFNGMSIQSGYYADVNLWFVMVSMGFYRFMLSDQVDPSTSPA